MSQSEDATMIKQTRRRRRRRRKKKTKIQRLR